MDLYDELVSSQPEDIVEWEDIDEGQESSTSSTDENPEDKVFTLPSENEASLPPYVSQVGHTEANNEALLSVDVHKNEEAPDLIFNLTPSSDSQPLRCTTIGGPSPRSGCVFPFVFHGKKFTSCTTFKTRRRGRPWCSTQRDSRQNFIPGDKHFQ